MAIHKTILAVGSLIISLLLIGGPALVRADDPTPTYTPTATAWPMPTLQYQNLRPTPSPYQITPQGLHMNIDGDAKAGELADNIINGYKFLNLGATEDHGGVVDLILFILMLLLVVQVLVTLISEDGD